MQIQCTYPSLSALGPLLAQIRLKPVTSHNDRCSSAIRAIKRAIASDFSTRYKHPDVCMLLNKATLLDLRLKSLAHPTEEQQEETVNSIVEEIVSSHLQSPAPVAVANAISEEHQSTAESSTESKSKKCVLEKLLGDNFTANATCESSFSVSLTDLVVLGELSRYKSEPVLELKKKPLEWWRSHHQSYPHLAKMA